MAVKIKFQIWHLFILVSEFYCFCIKSSISHFFPSGHFVVDILHNIEFSSTFKTPFSRIYKIKTIITKIVLSRSRATLYKNI